MSQVRVLHDRKNGGLVSTEKPCTFWTPRHAKNPGISWVFWGGIFFDLPFWKGRSKKIPSFSSAFGVYHPRSQGYITQETRTISPAGLSSIMKVVSYFRFAAKLHDRRRRREMGLQNNETSVWEDYLAQGGNKRGTMRAQLIPCSVRSIFQFASAFT